jgi:CheY-like chemotaxis protein
MSGFELLEEIRTDRGLKMLPVFMLTTSNTEDDIARAETLRVVAYLSKPLDINEFEAAVTNLSAYSS